MNFIKAMSAFNRYMSEDFLGGPRFIKMTWVINFQKFGTFIFIGLLMWFYGNYTAPVWVYLALHGTYGFCWLLKHFTFPDPGWEKKVTVGGALMMFILVLGLYWVFPFILISGIPGPDRIPPSMSFLAFCISLHTMGVALMMTADAQKYHTLKYRSGLITDGMFKRVRHPNYLGEIMIYGSYALIVGHWIPWVILGWIWSGVFLTNILMIEDSLSRYPEWSSYKKKSGMLLPKISR